MRLEDDELVFYDFEWIVDNNVVSHDKQYGVIPPKLEFFRREKN